MVYVTRWFDRRRGSALALISSGQYIAGVVWPSLFERGITLYGWHDHDAGLRRRGGRWLILPLTLLFLRPAPEPHADPRAVHRRREGASVLGLPPNLVLALICVAAFFCCIPMAVPNGHLVAFCTDLGIAADAWRGDAVGAAGLRLHQPAVLGHAGRPHRRAARGDGRLGLPGAWRSAPSC